MIPYIKTAADYIIVISYAMATLLLIVLFVFWPLAVLGMDGLIYAGELYPMFWALMAANAVEYAAKNWSNKMLSYIRAALLLAAYNIFAVGVVMLFGLPFRWSVVIAANVYLAAMAAVLWYAQRGE